MEKRFTIEEINEAIKSAKEMLSDTRLPIRTALAQMGGYIIRHLNESFPAKKGGIENGSR